MQSNYGVSLRDEDMNLALENTGSSYRVPQVESAPSAVASQPAMSTEGLTRQANGQTISNGAPSAGTSGQAQSSLLAQGMQAPQGRNAANDTKHGVGGQGGGFDMMGLFGKIFGFGG